MRDTTPAFRYIDGALAPCDNYGPMMMVPRRPSVSRLFRLSDGETITERHKRDITRAMGF